MSGGDIKFGGEKLFQLSPRYSQLFNKNTNQLMLVLNLKSTGNLHLLDGGYDR